MSTEGVMLRDGNSIAGANFSKTAGLAGPNGSAQFLAVKFSTAADRTYLLVAGANARSDGILQNAPVSGDSCDVCFEGECKAVYGGTVAAGDYLTTDSSARLVTATTGQLAIAKAKMAGALGDIASVRVFNGTIIAP
jgi:hypothetical protein